MKLHYKSFLNNFWCQSSSSKVVSSFAFGTLVKNRMEVYKYLKKFNIESRPLICGNIGRHPFWITKNGKSNLRDSGNIESNLEASGSIEHADKLSEIKIIVISLIFNPFTRNSPIEHECVRVVAP